MEFVRQCLIQARQANPKATLLLNDYYTGPAFERLIEQFVDPCGKPLCDVIGIQSHMYSGVWPTKELRLVCQQFARFGVPLHFTETTIISGDQLATNSRLALDAPRRGPAGPGSCATSTHAFTHPAVEAITWWDLSDWHSWLQAPPALFETT